MNVVADRWRAAFGAQPALFASLADGARIGFVARADFGSVAGRRIEALAQAGERAQGALMLAFEAQGGAMRVEPSRFEGFERASIDLLLVADDEAMAELAREADTFTVAKRALRRGAVMFYALKPKHALQDAGYEDFLDSLGLAFLGACR